jgi:hypothetical protein
MWRKWSSVSSDGWYSRRRKLVLCVPYVLQLCPILKGNRLIPFLRSDRLLQRRILLQWIGPKPHTQRETSNPPARSSPTATLSRRNDRLSCSTEGFRGEHASIHCLWMQPLLKLLLWKCINTWVDLESCGGCPGNHKEDGSPAGIDCTALPNVNDVSCLDGSCAIGMSLTLVHCEYQLTYVLAQSRALMDMFFRRRMPPVSRSDTRMRDRRDEGLSAMDNHTDGISDLAQRIRSRCGHSRSVVTEVYRSRSSCDLRTLKFALVRDSRTFAECP